MGDESSSPTRALVPAKFTYYIYRGGNSTDTVKKTLEDFGWTAVNAQEAQATGASFVWKPDWTGKNMYEPPPTFSRGNRAPLKRQAWNHLRAVEPLCTKDSLFQVMSQYYSLVDPSGAAQDAALPLTFLVHPIYVSDGAGGAREWPGWAAFTEKFNACAADPTQKNLWLAKPTGNNRGIGIEVFKDYEEIRKFLDTKSRAASHGVNTTWVLQKYLESPLLYKGRKFDLRVWVVVLDNGDVYVHAPGYVRTSSNAFTLDTTERYVHLTNFCQQVNNESFGTHEEGNTLKWDDLVAYLDSDILPKRAAMASRSIGGQAARMAEAVAKAEGSGSDGSGKPKDPPVATATTGAEVMWGCGSNGVWGQIRKHIRDSFEALRGRGGSRTQGCEENGFARKPPAGIAVPKRGRAGGGDGEADGKEDETAAGSSAGGGSSTPARPSAAFGGTSAGAGTACGPGSRHRFELLGYDFMIDRDFRVHFIEVNTNPSLTYQAGWHEAFVDAMMERTLSLIFAETWPEVYRDKYSPPAVPAGGHGSGVRPEDGWQHIFNVYTAPLRHAGQAGPAAMLAMQGLARGGSGANSGSTTPAQARGLAGKENTGAQAKPGLRMFQAAAAKVIAAAASGAPPAAAAAAVGKTTPARAAAPTTTTAASTGPAAGAGAYSEESGGTVGEGDAVSGAEGAGDAGGTTRPASRSITPGLNRTGASSRGAASGPGSAGEASDGDEAGKGAGGGAGGSSGSAAAGAMKRSASTGRLGVRTAAAGLPSPSALLHGRPPRLSGVRAVPKNRIAAVARAVSVGAAQARATGALAGSLSVTSSATGPGTGRLSPDLPLGLASGMSLAALLNSSSTGGSLSGTSSGGTGQLDLVPPPTGGTGGSRGSNRAASNGRGGVNTGRSDGTAASGGGSAGTGSTGVEGLGLGISGMALVSPVEA